MIKFKHFFLILLMLNFSSAWGNESNTKISKAEATDLANKKVTSIGYNLSELSVDATWYKTPENKCISHYKGEFHERFRSQLEGKKYWAVNYRPDRKIVKQGHKGGSVCVFVDSEQGEIITYVGKK